MNITFREIEPSARLKPFVDCYWLQQFSNTGGEISPVQRCPPFGTVELIVHLDDNCCDVLFDGKWQKLPRIFVAGMYRDSILWRSCGNSRKFGIRLNPEVLSLLFNVPAAKLYSDYTEIDNFGMPGVASFAEQLCETKTLEEAVLKTEEYLTERLLAQNVSDSRFVQAVSIMRSSKGSITVEQVSSALSVSPRHLQRVFKDELGASPKTYGRIIRFSNAYKLMQQLDETGGWAGLSYYLGYADQAHFIREFKEFSGLIPNVMLHDDGQIFGKQDIAV